MFTSSLQLHYHVSLRLHFLICKMGVIMSAFQCCYQEEVRRGV